MTTSRGRLVIGTTIKEQLATSFFPHLDRLRAAGWEVHLVASDGPWPSPVPEGVEFHAIPMVKEMSPRADAAALRAWVRLLAELQPQAVIGGSPKGALLAMLAARYAQVPVRIYLHRGARWESLHGWRRQVTLQADRLTAAAATTVVAVSDSLADALRKERVVQIPPVIFGGGGSKGVDLERFAPAERSADQPPVVGYVGRLSRDKGLETVLAAWDHLRTSTPQARLVVIGDIDDADPPPVDVQRRIRDDAGIEWLGWRSDVADLMPTFTVLAFPSAREGLPNVVIEAAACAVPCVGWDVTGVRDAIHDGVSGRLLPEGDIPGFVRAVEQIATSSQPQRWRSGARQWATRFDQTGVTAGWVSLLDSEIAARTTVPSDTSALAAPAGESDAKEPQPHGLGIAVVTYNSAATIADCVASLATHAPDAHVAIVDNSGQAEVIRPIIDDAVQESAGKLSSVTVIGAPGNIGYAAGVNLAVSLLPEDCEFLLICNPDVVVTADPRILVPGLRRADVTAGHLLGELPNASRATTYTSEVLRGLAGVRFRYAHIPRGAGDRYVDQLAGAYLFQRMDYYRRHRLDERFELYYEDVTYCDWAREEGRGVLLQDVVVGTHTGGASSGRVAPTTYRAGRVSRARYLRQRYPSLPRAVLAFPFALERLVRSATGQAEGSVARKAASRDVAAELAKPGSVRVLTEFAPNAQSTATPETEGR